MSETSKILQDILAQLQALPPDDFEWERLPAFIASLQTLADSKLAQREHGRSQLRQALATLGREASDPLAWWSYDVTTWAADHCAWAEAAALAQKVQEWQAALLRHDELRKAPAGSRAEERARRSTVDSLETAIERSYSDLSAALSPHAPGPLVPTGTDVPTPAAPPEPAADEKESTEEIAAAADSANSDVAGYAGLPDEEAALTEPSPSPLVVPEALPAETDLSETESAEIGGFPDRPAGTDESESAPEPAISDEPIWPEAAYTFGEDVPSMAPVSNLEWLDLGKDTLETTATTPTADLEPALTGTVQDEMAHLPPVAAVDDTDEAWHALLWEMMAEDDLSGAYWVVKSLGAQGRPTPVPDWLLAAVQASRWVTADTPGLMRDLLQISRSHSPAENAPVHELLALAAALRSALVAPFSGMITWVDTPAVCPALSKLVLAVRSFADLGIGLHREDVRGLAGDEQRDEGVVEASREARRWLEEAPSRRERVTSVWRALVGPKGALKELLLPVCENRQEQVDAVRSELESWQDRPTVYARFDLMNAADSPGRPERVRDGGKQDLYREVEKATDIAERWCDAVKRARHIGARGNWFREQVAILRASAEQALPDIDAALHELAQNTQPASLAVAARVLQASLRQIRVLLDLATGGDRPADAEHPLWTLAVASDSLEAMLADRLLWFPEVPLNDSGAPTPAGLPLVAQPLRAARLGGRTLRTAADLWLAQQDYRFFDRLVTALADDIPASGLRQRYEEALGASRAALRASIAATSSAIEQALLDEAIDDEQRASYGGGFASLAVEEVRNFKAKLAELDRIRHDIRRGYQKRLRYLREQHALIAERLKTSLITADRQQAALAFVAAALDRIDVRVVVESQARLREVLDTGADLPEDWYARAPGRDWLVEFNSAAPHIERWLAEPRRDLRTLATSAAAGAAMAGIPFDRLEEPRRKEAAEALLSWRMLKQQGAKGNNGPAIAAVLRYLGFDLKTGDAASVDIARMGADWLHARAAMSAGNLARPIPEFGSQAQGLYEIICLWERPGAGAIAARLRDLHLDAHTVIVLYLGPIPARQKRDIIRVSRDQELAIAVLDETLLVFLAQGEDVRLRAFLRCALPFSALSPFRPFQFGDVPSEIFYGREAMARELQRQGGSCLVYGGRQLGKSALLRHVERQFHHPEREQYAWVENMKLIFDPAAGRSSGNVWRNLREGFKAQKLLDSRITTDRPEEIARYIREAMRANPKQRVIVMLDESDEFLDADAKDGFRTVIALRDLMLNTGQRFKVIFAGLQNVQRFQGIPDQPLAHFGTPRCVGPLEPGEAQLLVREPLEVLGYRFTDNGALLRILSYTNYHPGLIQYFCQELLKQLRERSGAALPPYQIRQEDIEAVYRNEQVRNPIRERFEWTLALDTHYQAIAWALIENQSKDRDGYARAYPPSDVLQLVREWWPAGFDDTGTDQLRGWLDELCGLGVLVRNPGGHYRLRSPNMVRLLGKETEIDDRLQELMTKSPIPVMDADSHHASLDDKAARYSPLTYAEERSLSQPRFGVGLVFASEAFGSGLLPAAVRRFLPVDLPAGTGDCTQIPSGVTAKDLDERLREYLDSQAKTERMILYQQVPPADPKDLAELVMVAHRFCQRHQARDRWLRILFLFDSQSTWHWLELPQSERIELEEAADAALWPRPWTLSAIRRRLVMLDKLDTDDAGSRAALRATGGWPYLLDVLCDRCAKGTDLRPTAQQIELDLATADSQLAQDFRACLGIARSDAAQRALKFVLEEGKGQVPEELLTPVMLGGSPELTDLKCNQAKEFLLRLGLVRLRGETLIVDPVIAQLMAQA